MFVKATGEFKIASAMDQLLELGRWLASASESGTAEHGVERHLFEQMLAMGRTLLGEFFRSVGPGDEGPSVALESGMTVRRLEGERERRLVTVFGVFTIRRVVYGTRAG